MLKRYAFDLSKPHPNVDIEAIRLALLSGAAGVDDSYFLTDLLFSLLDTALAAVDDLTARVVALENPSVEELP